MGYKVAIVGAGFGGVGLAYFLSGKAVVDVYDMKGIGGGASGVASGLLHPYPGKKCLRSKRADEALAAAMELVMRVGAFKKGIVRKALDDEQRALFEERAKEHDDLTWNGELHIHSGVTVYAKEYLEGLWKLCDATLHISKVGLEDLGDYDRVIVAAGYGVREFFPELNVRYNKGQILECRDAFKRSVIGDGYVAGKYIGSTYEHDFTSIEVDFEEAKRLILPRAERYVDEPFEVVGAAAGVRVAKVGDYMPIAQQIDARTFVLTAFGSRGLLYHALLAKELVHQVVISK